MKIAICGSIAFFDRMLEIKNRLELMRHEAFIPPTQIRNEKGEMISVKEYYEIRKSVGDCEKWVWDRKEELIRDYFNLIEKSDAILVLNHKKNGVEGYIGGNTLMEMGLGFHLRKKIFLLNSIPEISYKEEILSMKPVVIDGDLQRIR